MRSGKILRGAVFAVILTSVCGVAAHGQWLEGWRDRRELLLNNVASTQNLVNFPLLVHLTSANFNFLRVQPNGQDVRFTDSDGTTLLPYEIERWDQAGREAWVWVKVPQIDAGSTSDKIYLYSDNRTAPAGEDRENVWNSDFHMVHHLNETSGTHYDSTSFHNNGTWVAATTPGSPATQDALGKIAGADRFWGYQNYPNPGGDLNRVDVPGNASLHGNPSITLEVWYKQEETQSWENHLVRTGGEWMLNTAGGSNTSIRFGRAGSGWGSPSVIYSSNAPELNQWHYAVGTAEWDGTNTILNIYIDGQLRGTTAPSGIAATLSYAADTTPVRIGARDDLIGMSFFHGILDEVRYSVGARSADWVQAQYLSMTDQFFTIGETIELPEPQAVLLALLGMGLLAALGRRRRLKRPEAAPRPS